MRPMTVSIPFTAAVVTIPAITEACSSVTPTTFNPYPTAAPIITVKRPPIPVLVLLPVATGLIALRFIVFSFVKLRPPILSLRREDLPLSHVLLLVKHEPGEGVAGERHD